MKLTNSLMVSARGINNIIIYREGNLLFSVTISHFITFTKESEACTPKVERNDVQYSRLQLHNSAWLRQRNGLALSRLSGAEKEEVQANKVRVTKSMMLCHYL